MAVAAALRNVEALSAATQKGWTWAAWLTFLGACWLLIRNSLLSKSQITRESEGGCPN